MIQDIKYMYGALALVTVCANVIFALLPSREVENCIEGKDRPKTSFRDQMYYITSTFTNSKIILLTILFMHLGLWTMFWVRAHCQRRVQRIVPRLSEFSTL